MAVFQDYLDNLPVFLPRFAPIFYQVCSDFGADLVLSDNTDLTITKKATS